VGSVSNVDFNFYKQNGNSANFIKKEKILPEQRLVIERNGKFDRRIKPSPMVAEKQ